MLVAPTADPSASFDDAVLRAKAMTARDDNRVIPTARTTLLQHGVRTPWAVVLFHGLTNHPGQYAQFAPLLHAAGASVFVPRMPYHGYADRLSTDIAALTAEQLIGAAYEAVDVACGLGERVAALGISMGGLQCAYLGQFRADVSTSVPIGPDFGLLQLPHGATSLLARVMRAVPNMFLWWDPRVRAAQRPKTAYPRFSTHALMQTVRIADAVYDAAPMVPAKAARIASVANRVDPAVNNEVTREVVSQWRALRSDGIEYIELGGLPENHDIIDPDNPLARTDLVYPKLIDILKLD